MAKELGKILVIDDNEDVLFAAKMLLKKHADFVQIEPKLQEKYDTPHILHKIGCALF